MKADQYGSPVEQRRHRAQWVPGSATAASDGPCRKCQHVSETLHCGSSGERSSWHCMKGDFSTSAMSSCLSFTSKLGGTPDDVVKVKVYYRNAGYVCRARGKTASCTMSAEAAAKHMATKLWPAGSSATLVQRVSTDEELWELREVRHEA